MAGREWERERWDRAELGHDPDLGPHGHASPWPRGSERASPHCVHDMFSLDTVKPVSIKPDQPEFVGCRCMIETMTSTYDN